MLTIFLIALSLSFDSFATSASVAIKHKKELLKLSLILALTFAIFQAGMPLVGYVIGSGLREFVSNIDHWIAFVLLAIIGAKFIVEAFEAKEKNFRKIDWKLIMLLGLATSIDALVVGTTFAFMDIDLFWAIIIIGVVTFLISLLGCSLGKNCAKDSRKIEVLGGLILIGIGTKILLTHLFF